MDASPDAPSPNLRSTLPGTASRPGPRRVGEHGETLAAEHLTSLGMELIARNWRVAAGELRGELDLVALDHVGACVVVVEVKTRRGGGWGGPLAAVGTRKQATLRRLATAFVVGARLPYHHVRIDVIGIRLDTRHLHHVVAAL